MKSIISQDCNVWPPKPQVLRVESYTASMFLTSILPDVLPRDKRSTTKCLTANIVPFASSLTMKPSGPRCSTSSGDASYRSPPDDVRGQHTRRKARITRKTIITIKPTANVPTVDSAKIHQQRSSERSPERSSEQEQPIPEAF